MNDRPSEPINLATQRDSNRVAIASKFAPKVFVTYPSFDVWRSVYDPNDLFLRFNDQRYGPGGYQSMRQSHLVSVTKSLNRIHDFQPVRQFSASCKQPGRNSLSRYIQGFLCRRRIYPGPQQRSRENSSRLLKPSVWNLEQEYLNVCTLKGAAPSCSLTRTALLDH